MKKLFALILIISLSLSLFACTIGVDSSESGHHKLRYIGRTLTVELVENPTTGYLWHPTTSNESIVLVDDEYSRSGGDPGADGTDGVHTYRFEGVEEGQTIVIFDFYRDYGDDVTQLSITVEVNSNGSIRSAKFEDS